jgi:hypothetical protein
MSPALIGSLLAFGVCIWLMQISRTSLGLPLVYLVGFMSQHLPGGLVHLLHPYEIPGFDETNIGMQMTAITMLSFTTGAAIHELSHKKKVVQQIQRQQTLRFDPVFWRFCAKYGIITAVVVAPIISFPSVGAIIKSASNLWILGVLLALRAYTSKGLKLNKLLGWIGVSLVSPFFTLIGSGFLGFGIAALSSAYCVLLTKPRKLFVACAASALAVYLAMGVAVTYFSGREEIRNSVWGGATNQQRLDSITSVFSKATFFNPSDLDHAFFIDLRLNQNYVIGVAESYMKSNNIPFFNGRTLSDAILALVPRALWPGKPIFAGSGSLVSDVTGIGFAEGTSVGIGSVLESYVNFGWIGLVLLNVPIGYFIRWLDFVAFRAESLGDYETLLTTFLPALALNAIGGVFAEVTAAALSSWLAAKGWFYLWKQVSKPKLIEG